MTSSAERLQPGQEMNPQESLLELKDVKKYFPIRSGIFQKKSATSKRWTASAFRLNAAKRSALSVNRAAESRPPDGR